MKKIILLAVLVVSTAAFVSAQSATDKTVEDEIRRLNTQEVEGLLKNDVKTLSALWSDDLVVTNPFNKFINKQQVVQMTASGTLAFSSYKRDVEYVRVYGDTAVVAGSETVVWAGKLPTAGQTSNLRFTSVWRKQGKTWQQVARHANMIGKP
jgi:ketosteroid isomerase-like protein